MRDSSFVATMSTPGLDSFLDVPVQDTFPKPIDVLRRKHGLCFHSNIEETAFEFVCVCNQIRVLRAISDPFSTGVPLHGVLRTRGKNQSVRRGLSLIERTGATCSGTLIPDSAPQSGLLGLIKGRWHWDLPGPTRIQLSIGANHYNPQRCIIQREKEYWAVMPIADEFSTRRNFAEGYAQ